MSSKSIKKNYIYNVSYQILLLITPLITAPYIARTLGADGVGTISYVESVVSYFVMFATLGISIYGQREISYVQDSVEKRSEIFWNTKILEFTTTLIVLAVYIIFAVKQKNMSFYLIYSLQLLSVFMDVTWFFQGMEEFGKVVLRNVILRMVNIVYLFAAVKTKDDIMLYALGMSFFSFLGTISLWGYLPKYVNKVKLSNLHPYKNLWTVISLFAPTVAIQIYTVLDKTMIGLITESSFENGYYEQAIRISKMVMTVVTALGTVMIPRIGHHFQKGETDTVKKLMYRGYRFVWFLGTPLCLGLIMIAGNFVPWFFGDGYAKVVPLIQILSLLILAIGINNVTGMQYLIPTKRQNTFTLTVIIGALTNFAMNIILIRIFQSIGAAIASVTAETVIAIVQIVIVRKELSPLQIIRESRNYAIAGIAMLCALAPLAKILSASIIHTLVMTCAGALVYFIVLILVKDELLLANLNVILSKLKNRNRR